MRRWSLRRTGAIAVAAVLLLLPAAGATANGGDEPEGGGEVDADAEEAEAEALEDSSLSGYRLRAEGTPLGVLLWESFFPFPVDPGDPHMELQSAYTRTTFNTGPTGRALASSLWPGAVFGDSMEQLIPETHYPLKADARVPQGPEEDELEFGPGTGLRTTAGPEGVEAWATTTDPPSDVIGIGTYESTSRSFLEDGEAITRARSSVQDVGLFGGLVEIAGVITDVEARGDGTRASTSGETTVSGVTIAGFGFVLDEDGLRPETGDDEEESPLPFGLGGESTPDELREALGIEIELLPHEEELAEEGAAAKRTAGGVRVSIDLETLRGAFLNDVLDPVEDQLPGDVRHPPMPDEFPVNPIDLLFLQPQVDLILARGVVEANTVEALDFDFDFGTQSDDLGPPSVPGADPGPEPDQATSPAPPSSAGQPDAPTGTAPVDGPEISESSPGEQEPELQAMAPAGLPDPAGSAVLATLVALGIAGLAARGLHAVTGSIFGGGAGCAAGHPTGVPDLKETGT